MFGAVGVCFGKESRAFKDLSLAGLSGHVVFWGLGVWILGFVELFVRRLFRLL